MIYGDICTSKDNQTIPLFSNGTPFLSKYSVERDSSAFASSAGHSDFFVIGGIGSGQHISRLLQENPDSFVLAFELDRQNLDYSQTFQTTSCLSKDKRICLCTLDTLEKNLLTYFKPVLYSSFSFTMLRSWENFCRDFLPSIKQTIERSLTTIKADYSVQSHFGTNWNRNILFNLRHINSNFPKLDLKKNFAVIGAGPSLEKNLKKLHSAQGNTNIICTDTALNVLMKESIIPDVVITTDCQHISSTHFFKAFSHKSTPFILVELSSPITLVKKLIENKIQFGFYAGNHPLEQYLIQGTGITAIDSSSGTVAGTALDLCIKSGAKNISFYGTDFCYNNNKAYTKGTYLEEKFIATSLKTESVEHLNSRLMFRTELENNTEPFIKIHGPSKTTETLSFYKRNILSKLNLYNFKKKLDSDYSNSVNRAILAEGNIDRIKINLEEWKNQILLMRNTKSTDNIIMDTLLPLVAGIRMKYPNKNFEESLKMAIETELQILSKTDSMS